MSEVPRIDQLRKMLDNVPSLLQATSKGLETLHELAYDRQKADQVRVAGGEPDYALDRHGDPAARTAYKRLATTVDSCCDQLSEAARDSLKLLNKGDAPGRNRQHPATITMIELAHAIETQARRTKRGEFDAGRTNPQPASTAAHTAVVKQLTRVETRQKQLAGQVTEIAHQLEDALEEPESERQRRQLRKIHRRLMRAINPPAAGVR